MEFLDRLRLAVILTAESVAVVAVHGLGERAPFDLPLTSLEPWLRAAPVDALAAALRVAALGVAWWLLVATVLYAGASVAGGRGRVARALRILSVRVTPRAIRLAVDRTLATSLAVGTLLVPVGTRAVASDDPSPHVIVDVRDGRDRGAITSLPTEPTRSAPRAEPTAIGEPTPPPVTVPAGPESRSVVVIAGDNLWSLSADALARATGRAREQIGDDEIARYWTVVCDANRATLRSGDVNLIYPGEAVVLPPVR